MNSEIQNFGMREEGEGGQVSELGDPKFKKGSRITANGNTPFVLYKAAVEKN